MSLSNNYPTIRPTLEFDFANVGALDPRITFTRATSATFVNQLGVIQTAAAGVPRFDYDPSTLAARGLLIEEQRTNLVKYSEDFANANWLSFQVNVSTNSATAPDGTSTADTLTATAGPYGVMYQVISVSAATAYTASYFLKANTTSSALLGVTDPSGTDYFVYVNLSTGTITSVSAGITASIVSYGNGWYRVLVNRTTASTAMNLFIGPYSSSGSIYAWGIQLEAGSFATSYIPTVASAVTRNADVATVNTLTPWYNATEGVLYAEAIAYAARVGGNPIGIASITDGGANNRLSLAFLNNATDNLSRLVAGGVSVLNATGGGASVNALSKIAAAYKSGDSAGVANGTLVQTASTSFSLSVANLVIGSGIPVTESLCGYIRRIAYYPARLTNAQLQGLTS